MAATARASAPAVPIEVVVSRVAARGLALLGLHLTGRLAISLSELDLDLPSAHPLPVQVVQGVLRVTDIFKRAALLRALTAQYTLQEADQTQHDI